MRFSVWPSPQRPWPDVRTVVLHCDASGWDGAYFADHFMPDDPDGRPVDGPVLECWSVLAALAAETRHVRLGSLVSGNLYRHPAVVANAAATIDHISGGRFVVGLGAGWQVNEHAAYGIDLLDVGGRLDHLEEACAVIKGLLVETRTTFPGDRYRITDAPCDPKPVQDNLPLLVGGRGEKRTMRIAARYADEWNAWGTAEDFRRRGRVFDDHCAAVGRDPSAVARSTQALVYLSTDEAWLAPRRRQGADRPRLLGTPAEMVDQVAAYDAVGVDELVIPDWMMGSAARTTDTLDLFWNEVAVHFPLMAVEPGDGGAWEAELDRRVRACVAQWSLEVGETFASSTGSRVHAARRPDGTEVVLKVQCPDRESAHESEALAHWAGNGAVRLVADHPGLGAFLTERCRPGTPLAREDPDEALGVLIGLLPRLWIAAGPPFGTLDDEAAHWARALPAHWERAGRPFERRLLDAAVDQMRTLTPSPEDRVLVHQDLHAGNVLRARRQDWLVIDPKPLLAERAFAAAPVVRGPELGGGRDDVVHRLDRVSAELGLDRGRVLGWTVAQTVAWAFGGETVIPHHVATARWLLDAR